MVQIGSRLGPYEIISRIGAGGMGEVWKARDTRLDRSVAIKVLPPEFASSPAFKQRFEREAKTISQLNHPHICTLHDVGSQDGVEYLVMELIEGESVADRLVHGPLPLGDVLRYGSQIAEALDRAHRAGVVHRDLKPGNVMIAKGGAKLLDFGLAKSGTTAVIDVEGATQQKPLTQEGTILGTFQYMAPEQLEGVEADPRTDIFALGAVLYEMATGKRAFEGKTRTSLIAQIVGGEPRPILEVQPLTPPALEHVIRRCLAKDPDDRWQSASDIAEELRWIGEAGSQAGATAPLIMKKRNRERAAWFLGALAAAITVGTISWFAALQSKRADGDASVYRLTITTPPGSVLGYNAGRMALSPDGRLLTYASYSSNGNALIVRRLAETTWRTLEGTTGASSPFWSPDGRQIGYLARGSLWKVAADGSGAPVEITRVPTQFASATWNRAGTILYAGGDKLYRVSASGGDLIAMTGFPEKARVTNPEFLPDGNHYLCGVRSTGAQPAGFIASLDSKEPPKLIVRGDATIAYAGGFLFFTRVGTLYAQPFDAGKIALSGEPRAIAKIQSIFSTAYFAVAGDTLVYLPQGSEVHTELQRVDRTGKPLGTIGQPSFFFSPRISHDGSRVAVDDSATGGQGDIWIFSTTSSAATRFTFDSENESAPVWSPDDTEITYFLDRLDEYVLMHKRVAGGQASVFFKGTGAVLPSDCSPDGKSFLVLSSERIGSPHHIAALSLPDWKPLTTGGSGSAEEGAARYSPDGRSFAYASQESGRAEVYVQPFPPNGSKWQVSVDGGEMPVWSRDGKSLFFVNVSGKLVESAVTTTADASFSSQPPQPLFGVALREGASMFAQYDVLADGTFLLNRIPETATTPMTIVLGWKETIGQ